MRKLKVYFSDGSRVEADWDEAFGVPLPYNGVLSFTLANGGTLIVNVSLVMYVEVDAVEPKPEGGV